VFNNINITLRCSVSMRTSCEKVSDEAEGVQSVSYSHIRSLSGLYTVVCLREGKRGTCLRPSGVTGKGASRPSWQAKCKNWAPFG